MVSGSPLCETTVERKITLIHNCIIHYWLSIFESSLFRYKVSVRNDALHFSCVAFIEIPVIKRKRAMFHSRQSNHRGLRRLFQLITNPAVEKESAEVVQATGYGASLWRSLALDPEFAGENIEAYIPQKS